MKSIGTKLSLQISVGLIIVIVAFGTLDVYQRKNTDTADLKAKEERVLQQLSHIMGDFLNNMYYEPINYIARSYLSDPHILSIKLLTDEKIITYLGKIQDTEEIVDLKQEEPQYTDDVTRQKEILFLGEPIGILEVVFTRKSIDDQVRRSMVNVGRNLIVVLIIASLIVSALARKNITTPLLNLVQVARQIADGDVNIHLPKLSSQNEIGILTTSFETMISYIQHIADFAKNISTGDLHHEISPRSEQDVLGHAFLNMSTYLNEVSTVAAAITEGDLTETVQVRSTDDAFGQAIQTMTKGLHDLIIQIRSSAEQIASTGTIISSLATHDINIVEQVQHSAEEMTATMREMGASVEEVAHNMDTLSISVEETSASVSQMTSSIAHIAANTNDLTDQTHQTIASLKETVASLERVVESTGVSKQLSQETIQDALRGQEAVEQVMNSMETIQHTVTTAVNAMTRFEQRSRDIDMILEVIREITEQTSLLALNASIIAAQAGMHGRGFAVVADEIRNLASGVGTSTKDIAAIVRTLQQDTSNVVHTIHEGVEDVEQGMERTQQARETLQKITTSAQQSSSVVTEIADTLHGVMTRSRTVSAAMEQVNAMTDDITSATNEQEASTRQIHQAIAQINEMASQIQQATTQQLTGVHQLLETTNNVTRLIDQNLESSQQIAHTTGDLSSQADILVHSVEQFKLEG